MPYQLLKQFWN